MHNIRRNFERFCYRNSSKGIPNLMLWIAVGNLMVYMLTMVDPSNTVYSLLSFSRNAILHGQIWRLFTYVLIPDTQRVFFFAIMLFFYFQIGRILENSWGTLKFNLYYLTGVLLTDVGALLLGGGASAVYLNLSLVLAFSTLYPDNQVLLFFIIPLRMKYLAWFYFALTALEVVGTPFPYNLFPLFALLNYFLYFGKDVQNVFTTNRGRSGSAFHIKKVFTHAEKKAQQPSTQWAAGYQSADGKRAYRHKCTVCGRTDTEFPDLEFRYCSKCNGYYCYCIDHINHHEHIR
ncbi:MAG: hypothetical protein PHS97_01685 [Oscillospiraceae bacterium]|nr:hypothetical protein [Oscillospiraceae bacterium]